MMKFFSKVVGGYRLWFLVYGLWFFQLEQAIV